MKYLTGKLLFLIFFEKIILLLMEFVVVYRIGIDYVYT